MGFSSVLLLVQLVACTEPLRPPVPPPDGHPVRGIDVSHHQGHIDWDRVAGSGQVQFAYVKATEGRGHVDRRFARNWARARDAGLPTGAYHYFSLCHSGADQAAHFIATVPVEPGRLPPVVDIEPDRRCNHGARWDSAEREVATWLDRVEAHYGVAPIVYASDWVHRHDLADLDADRWVAAYSRAPAGSWVMWQYTDRGAVPGILGPVDHNVMAAADPP